jgi:hypothetical protein
VFAGGLTVVALRIGELLLSRSEWFAICRHGISPNQSALKDRAERWAKSNLNDAAG